LLPAVAVAAVIITQVAVALAVTVLMQDPLGAVQLPKVLLRFL
jgi:hypothetical protein